MNTLIYYSFNVIIFAAVVLIVGLIKPKWIFLWMDKPSRIGVVAIAGALVMAGMVMFGEGNKQMQQEKAKATATAVQPQAEVPNVAPAAAAPAAKPATP